MNAEADKCRGCEQLEREFQHLRSDWWWLLLFGILLVVCGIGRSDLPGADRNDVLRRCGGVGSGVGGGRHRHDHCGVLGGQMERRVAPVVRRRALRGRRVHDHRRASVQVTSRR